MNRKDEAVGLVSSLHQVYPVVHTFFDDLSTNFLFSVVLAKGSENHSSVKKVG